MNLKLVMSNQVKKKYIQKIKIIIKLFNNIKSILLAKENKAKVIKDNNKFPHILHDLNLFRKQPKRKRDKKNKK